MSNMQALIIKTAGNPEICRAVAQSFESDELRKLRLQNAVLRRNRDELKQRYIEALGREIDEMLYGRRFLRHFKKAFWRGVGSVIKRIERGRR